MSHKKWVMPLIALTTLALLTVVSAGAGPPTQEPQAPDAALSTEFTYQGQLNHDGQPVDDACDFEFSLYDDELGQNQVGSTQTIAGVEVTGGLFTVQLDFGATAFAGDARWLGVQVQCQGDAGYTDLGLQALTATPYALYALGVPWDGISDLPAGFADGVDDVTAVVSGTAIYVGEGLNQIDSGESITLSITPSYRLPQTCAGGQIAEWDGAAWACGDDDVGSGSGEGDVTAVYAGDGLTGGGESGAVTLSADLAGSGSATSVSRSDHDHWGQGWSGSGIGIGLSLSGGEIGLQATGSSRGVWGEASATDGWGVYGYASATSGTTYGVFGQTTSTDGRGVFGRSLTGGGETAGVYGVANSYEGYGVYGQAPIYGLYGYADSTTGYAHGVHGQAESIWGSGVYGQASAASGTTYGVHGQANSTSGSGVYGYASATSGTTYGVHGQADSPNGRGVYGYNNATSGSAIGVSGSTTSPQGRGVYGWAGATSGATYGVYGWSSSSEGYGVYGTSGGGSGTTYGVYGQSGADQGHGVHGYASDSSGNTYGVYGEAVSTYGTGVYGLASATYGATYGVVGRSESAGSGTGVYGVATESQGYGVYGLATNTTGTNYGVYGRTGSHNGYAGYFDGRLYAKAYVDSTALPSNHAAQIYNTSAGTSPDVLALKVGNSGDPGDAINFITFFNGNNSALGAVEGDGSGGVTFKSGSGDYAEFLPRLDPQEAIEPGDVVGVFDGQISKATQGASQVLAISSRPIVLGNDPGQGNEANYEKVALLGQVRVKVRGPVAAGDFLLPSGREDGTAMAVAPEAITAEQFDQVVGQAWESSADPALKTVLTVVGRIQHDPTVARLTNRVEELETKNANLEARLSALESQVSGGSGALPIQAGFLPGAGLLLVGGLGLWLVRRKEGER